MLTEILKTLKPLARSNEVTIQLSKSKANFFVLTDELKIKQALQNIIGNGIKYNKKGGTLSINLEEEENNILIFIKDEGIGIPKVEQGMIFERFYRASNTNQQASLGTGLGLFIAREIIRQSGGGITFKSEENKGTAFHITLPATKEDIVST